MALIVHETPFGFAPAGNERGAALPLARVGLFALAALPGLMVASVVLSMPLAVPATLGAGFLAVSWALHTGSRGTALAFTLAVLAGMVLATTLMTMSTAGHALPAAAALVPLFAAAPAGLRIWTERRRMAPRTPASRVTAWWKAEATETTHGEEGCSLLAVPSALDALAGESGSDEALFASASPSLCNSEPDNLPGEICVVGEAVSFALKLIGAEAGRRSVTLVQLCDPQAAVYCERRALRQIVRSVGADAIRRAERGSDVQITVRGLRGAVLLRVVYEESEGAKAGRDGSALEAAARLVADAGGTLLSDRGPEGHRISVRLPRAGTMPQAAGASPQEAGTEGQHAMGAAS